VDFHSAGGLTQLLHQCRVGYDDGHRWPPQIGTSLPSYHGQPRSVIHAKLAGTRTSAHQVHLPEAARIVKASAQLPAHGARTMNADGAKKVHVR
jgi:hypothetical protein